VSEQLERILEKMSGQLGEIIRLLEKKAARTRKIVQDDLPATTEGLPRIAEIWNRWADTRLTKVVHMSPSSARFKKAMERWREKPSEDYWVKVICRINRSSFCRGENGRRWIADIEFLLRPDTHAMVLEGKYDDKTIEKPVPQSVGYVIVEGQKIEVLK
jgi:hypothetical protein